MGQALSQCLGEQPQQGQQGPWGQQGQAEGLSQKVMQLEGENAALRQQLAALQQSGMQMPQQAPPPPSQSQFPPEVLFFPDPALPCRNGANCHRGASCTYAHGPTRYAL